MKEGGKTFERWLKLRQIFTIKGKKLCWCNKCGWCECPDPKDWRGFKEKAQQGANPIEIMK